jgi:hypothetical protein
MTPRDQTPHTVIYTVRKYLNLPLIRGMVFETMYCSHPTSGAALDYKDRLVREFESNITEQLYYAAVIRDSDGYCISSSTHSPKANYA